MKSRLYAPGVICFGRRFLTPMSTPSQPTPSPAGDRHAPATASAGTVEPPFEERLRILWEKYRGLITLVCIAVLAAIVGRAGWQILQDRRAAAQAAAFAEATSTEQLKSFAAEHAGSELAGVAHMKVGDDAYTAGRFTEAAGAYDSAADALETPALVARARIGAAVARLKAGQADVARTGLQGVANDVSLPETLRAEAAYHLASSAAAAGQGDELGRLLEQINAIEPNGLWAQRADSLRQHVPSLSTAPTTGADEAEPAVSFPGQTP